MNYDTAYDSASMIVYSYKNTSHSKKILSVNYVGLIFHCRIYGLCCLVNPHYDVQPTLPRRTVPTILQRLPCDTVPATAECG
ncbi:hypothetical protein JTB14_020201 [Gonioctena quinquepunctata]|nr:hypothetical protein JTB14_020201 [Gonioctena quinquepunctata]